MSSLLKVILETHIANYPQFGEQPELVLKVPTHDPNRDHSKYRISDAGKCHLMRYWKRQGKPATDTIKPKTLLQFQMGHIIHAYIEKAVELEGFLLDSEGEVEDDHVIGHFDMLLQCNGDQLYLYDIKSLNSKTAYFMAKNDFEPKRTHILQICNYAERLPAVPTFTTCIAYVTRDTMDINERTINVTRYRSEMLNDWKPLINAWETQEEPKATPEAKWECSYCRYRSECEHSLAEF